MSELNKSYRIRTGIGDESDGYLTIPADMVQDFDTFEVLSVSIKSKDTYKLHNADYGVVVGRVLGNNGFGIPNAKLSIFIEAENTDDVQKLALYPFASSISKDSYGIRYNLLPDNKLSDCHKVVGTFPNKRYLLDNDDLIEIYDKYYKYTTRTNNSGDYIIYGVPTGQHTLHMDLDLSDCGILSQKPRDFVYKGYTIEQFENPNMFKGGHEFNSLSQVVTQDQVINVNPFWGNDSIGETIGITRADIDVAFKFEPTCVFIGSVISDNASNGISRKCIPSDNMGLMEEMTTGEGRIEMIRKTPGGSVEEFEIKGTQLINSDGVWCYQIPMNLDYLTTDEYGNMVPTDDPDKGIPTRASVRFRLSMQDNEENKDNYHRAKVLIPHNPKDTRDDYDYEFGTYTKEDSFRDLFWNNVYSVKSYIPRFQRRSIMGWREKGKFTGIKGCNFYGQNNPMPYNNIRIRLPLMFMIVCALIKAFIFIISLYNRTIKALFNGILAIVNVLTGMPKFRANLIKFAGKMRYMILKDGLCPDLENWYFAPLGNYEDNNKYKYQCVYTDKDDIYEAAEATGAMCEYGTSDYNKYCIDDCTGNYDHKFTVNLLKLSLNNSINEGNTEDEKSIDYLNKEDDDSICITTKTDYLIACIEMALANEFKVINFDFYNDWINGTVYIPRWVRYIKPKKKFLGITWSQEKTRGCMDNTKIFSRTRLYTQQCAINHTAKNVDGVRIYHYTKNPLDNNTSEKNIRENNRYHQSIGFKQYGIFGKNGGICHEATTLKKQHVYYLKPCEFSFGKKVNLFATDLILLGSLNDCDENGIPMAFKHLSSTSFLMPPNIALTNMENNGPLYGKDGSVLCMGGETQNNELDIVNEKTIVVAKQTLTDEANYFSGGGYINEYSESTENIDTIPITEQAGISWNYTGPGQGEINEKKMYYPGGHFLGLSCINSQSNIKSCINLSRICEVGANMSQRREDAREYNQNTGELGFVYSVPSGFISGDDIVDTDFRSMFATLNSKRLIASKKNKETGYKYYDFMFSRPINFDGSFQSVVYMNGSEYNIGENRGSRDESESLHNTYGAANGYDNDDYDQYEYEHTQTKTKELPNLYYYMFRFGYDDISKMETSQKSKFLYEEEYDVLYMPQYENSYYFYFGLKQGSSAIDEFNKQFFAQCETMTLEKESSMYITTTFSACTNKGNATIITNNMEIPYHSIKLTKNGEEYILENVEEFLYSETFTIENLPYGNYEITIIDDNFVTLSRKFSIGEGFVTFDVSKVDFTVNLVDNELPPMYSAEEIYRGGFVDVSNIDIDGMDLSEFAGNVVTLKLYNEEEPSTDFCVKSVTNFNDTYRFYAKKKGVYYRLLCIYQCNGYEPVEVELNKFKFNDNSDIKLRIGNRSGVNYDCIIDENGEMRPYMKKMGNDWWWDSNNGYDISLSEKDKWMFRRYFFKESQSSNETFDSMVYSENGDKVIWGSPQNRYVILRTSACSMNYLEIPNGYNLDDENTQLPTYGVFSDTSVQTATTQNDRSGGSRPAEYINLQYSAIAVNGENTCGNYFITYNKNRHPKLANVTSGKYFKNGYGCVFKPMPTGDLLYMFYDDSNDYYNMIINIEDNRSDAEYGIIYPTFIYPVMRRPFYANLDMFLWSETKIEKIDGEFFDSTLDCGIKTEGKIHNGITYNSKFDNTTWVSGFDNIEFSNSVNNISNDLSGLTYFSPKDRIIEINKYKKIEGITSSEIGYNIKSGHPEDVIDEDINKISYNFDGSFAERFYAIVSKETNEIIGFEPNGGDDNIYYCLMKYGPSDNINFIVDGSMQDGHRYVVDHENMSYLYRVLCEFSNNGSELVDLHESQYGKRVLVKFLFAGNFPFDVIFDYIDSNGTPKEYRSTFNAQGNGNINNIDGVIDKLGTVAGGYGLPLKGVKNLVITENPTIDNQNKTWKDVINKLRNSRHLFSESYFRTKTISFNENTEKLFGLGFVEETTRNGGKCSIYKIYPNLYYNYGQDISWGDGLGNIWISETTYSCDAATHSGMTFSISASSPTIVTIDKPDWIEFSPSRIDINEPSVYTFTMHVLHNNSEQERNYGVRFISSSNNEKTLNVYQDAAVGIKILTMIISPVDQYVQGNLVELKRSVYAKLNLPIINNPTTYVTFDADITYTYFITTAETETITVSVSNVRVVNPNTVFVNSHFGLACDVGYNGISVNIKDSNSTNKFDINVIRGNVTGS